jgi:hypothetical protein
MIKKICQECFEIYGNFTKRNVCPKVMCGEDLIEVDDLLIPVIINLNRKHYKTIYCCSGHITEPHNFLGAYIMFTEESFEKLIKNNPPPKYWYYDGQNHLMRPSIDKNALVRYESDKPTTRYRNLTKEFMKRYRNKFADLTRVLDSLYDWSDSLQ